VLSGGGFGVGLTVADLASPSPGFGPPVTSVPSLGELLPVSARSPEEKAAELQRVDEMEAALAAYELELVAGFAADRPASEDRQPGEPGAAACEDTAPEGALASSPDHPNQTRPAPTTRHPAPPTTRRRSDLTRPAAVLHGRRAAVG
jgi:hypothetical protein